MCFSMISCSFSVVPTISFLFLLWHDVLLLPRTGKLTDIALKQEVEDESKRRKMKKKNITESPWKSWCEDQSHQNKDRPSQNQEKQMC